MDPRNYQIAALSTFIVFGIAGLGFTILLPNAIGIVSVALLTQWLLFSKSLFSTPLSALISDAKSALISALSLILLLRTDLVLCAGAAAFIAIASKKFIRINHFHIFNPSALALVVVTGITSHAYLSPGQWGPLGLFAFCVMGVGLLVVTRAQRLDVSLAFIVPFALMVLLRNVYLGDPLAIAWHQLQSGALLLFAFFMITDPRTTPLNKSARIVFGFLVSVATYILQFHFYISSAAIFALVAFAPLTIVLNFYFKENADVKKNIIHYCIRRFSELQQRYGVLRVLRR